MRITRKTGRQNNIAMLPLIAALSAAVASIALLAGCSPTPIFATIETEIPLATPTVLGRVTELFWASPNGTTRELYLTNGKLKRKTSSSNSWADIPLPASSTALRVLNIATDSYSGDGSLYALFVKESDWAIFDSVQRYNGSNWEAVTVPAGTSIEKIGSGNGEIYAFVKNGQSGSGFLYDIYAISGTAFPASPGGTNVGKPLAASGDYVVSSDTVYRFNGATFDAVTVDGKTTANVSIATDSLGNAYLLSTGGVYVSNDNGSTWTPHGYTVTSPAQSISVLETSGSDFILVSGMTGYCEIVGEAGNAWGTTSQVPGVSATSSIATESNAQYTSSLALYCVSGIFAVSNHTPSGDPYAIYGSVLDDTFDGLWGYYPTTRANWNRES